MELSAYELQRAANIKANEEQLSLLGLESGSRLVPKTQPQPRQA